MPQPGFEPMQCGEHWKVIVSSIVSSAMGEISADLGHVLPSPIGPRAYFAIVVPVFPLCRPFTDISVMAALSYVWVDTSTHPFCSKLQYQTFLVNELFVLGKCL